MPEKVKARRDERKYRNGVAKRRITIEIKGSADIGGYSRLSDFLKQLDAIKVALRHTERLHAHSENAVDYRIVSLSMASPATVVPEEIPSDRSANVFNRNIKKIIGPDQIIEGSLTGRLLAINLQ